MSDGYTVKEYSCYEIHDESGRCANVDYKVDANKLLRILNAHDDLVAVLKWIKDHIVNGEAFESVGPCMAARVIDEIDAALTKAEGRDGSPR